MSLSPQLQAAKDAMINSLDDEVTLTLTRRELTALGISYSAATMITVVAQTGDPVKALEVADALVFLPEMMQNLLTGQQAIDLMEKVTVLPVEVEQALLSSTLPPIQ